MKDNIFKKLDPEPSSFVFDEKLVPFFDDMVSRSVPCYKQLQQAILLLLKKYLKKGSSFYDLGASTGTTISLALQMGLLDDVHIHALDASAAMIDQAKLNLSEFQDRITFHHHHLKEDFSYDATSVFLANLTFQFLNPRYRLKQLQSCYQALLPGGALIYVEKLKVKSSDQCFFDDLYRDFKYQQGYSYQEIFRKEKALMNVLQPLTLSEHQSLFKEAGFQKTISFFQYFQFWGMVGVK